MVAGLKLSNQADVGGQSTLPPLQSQSAVGFHPAQVNVNQVICRGFENRCCPSKTQLISKLTIQLFPPNFPDVNTISVKLYAN